MLRDARFTNGVFHGPLDDGLVDMVAALVSGTGILPTVLLGESPLPSPFTTRIRVLSIQGGWHLYPSEPLCEVLFVHSLDLPQMFFEGRLERDGEHRTAILGALSVPNDDLIATEIDLLVEEDEALHPVSIRLLCPRAVMAGAQSLGEAV